MRDDWVYADAMGKGWHLVCLIGGGISLVALIAALLVGASGALGGG